MKRALLLLILLVAPVFGAEVKVPAEVQVQPGRLASVIITSTGKYTRFVSASDDLDCFREYDPDPKVIRLRLIGYKAGRHKVIAYTAEGDVPSEPAICTVVVLGDPIPPTPPVPPVPPTPPTPPDPGPTDPLTAKLTLAYSIETDADKAALKTKLAGIYRQGAEVVKGRSDLTTFGQLFDALAAVAKLQGLAGKLLEVQKVLQIELQAKLPRVPTEPLTAANRATTADLFNRVAASLEAVK